MTSPRLDLHDAFPDGTGYFGAATLGLPPHVTVEAVRRDLERWASGRASGPYYDDVVASARASYATLVGVGVDRVAIGSQVSTIVGMLADSVPDGAEVVCAEQEFGSLVFPFMQNAHRGVTVRSVPLDTLAAAVTDRTHLVAFSMVQSATGAIADVDAILTAAATHGASTLCDLTQAAGWMPVDAARFDATVCHTYKWLCAPRGVAFLTVRAAFAESLRPSQAGWYAGEDPWTNCYGPAIDLAHDARRFDVSPGWPAWAGAAASLELFASLDMTRVHEHDAALGDAWCRHLGLPERGQAIVAWDDPDGTDLALITRAGLVASGRAGRARVSFHVWNDDADLALLQAALA